MTEETAPPYEENIAAEQPQAEDPLALAVKESAELSCHVSNAKNWRQPSGLGWKPLRIGSEMPFI